MSTITLINKNKVKPTDTVAYLLLAIISFIVIYTHSYVAMPRQHAMAGDQDLFYVIGRNWAEGLLPYVTAWDSKGPIVFFFNMLGYLISGDEKGIVLIEALNFTAVLWCCHYLLTRYCNKVLSAICLTIFTANYCTICSGGNMAGSYTLLLSALSTFLMYRWSNTLQNGKPEHPYRYSVVYGLMFAGCVLSRLTNAIMLCTGMLGILSALIHHRKWRNILGNVVAFAAGFAILFAPFAIYFACHNAFHDMWYASITYNIEYALNSSPIDIIKMNHPVLTFIFNDLCLITTLLIAIMELVLGIRRKTAIFWGCISLVCIIWIFNSQAYANYTISYLPVVFVGMIELKSLRKAHIRNSRLICLTVLLVALAGATNHARTIISQTKNETKEVLDEADAECNLLKAIPTGDTYILYNCRPIVYATNDIRPYYPYFVYQDWATDKGESLLLKVKECFAKGDAKWIIVKNYGNCHIKDILLNRYEICKADEAFQLTLWRLK